MSILDCLILCMCAAPEHVRLADFEFCTSSPALGPVGSIGYAAPETLGNLPYTTAVDVWAGGVCLYAMLAASAPFDCPESAAATARRILSAQPGSLHLCMAITARILNPILLQGCLSKKLAGNISPLQPRSTAAALPSMHLLPFAFRGVCFH